jgi:predicted nucleotidyltransferase
MITKEYTILEPFVKRPWAKMALKEVKKLSGKSSESYTYDTLKRFVKAGVLKEEKAGVVTLYSLNLLSLKAREYIGFAAEHIAWQKNQVPKSIIEKLSAKIPNPFYTFIVTGSYANNTQKHASDLDIVIIADAPVKRIYSELRYESEISIPPVHLYAFTPEEFLAMLLEKKGTYGIEIIGNNLIYAGGAQYFKIISEALNIGLNGRNLP